MIPFLFPNTPFEAPTYFVLYLLGFLGAILMCVKRAEKFNLPPVRAVDLGIVLFIAGVAGARLVHIFIEAPSYYWEAPQRIFFFWQGGFVFYGGLIFGTLAGIFFMKYLKQPVGAWADAISPAIMLGLAIGRMGCLAAGCCFGKPTDFFWAMSFESARSAAPLHIGLHPTQLLEALYCFAAAAVLYFFVKKPLKPAGLSVALSFMAYSVFRFFLEYLRGDKDRGLYFNQSISTSQIISVILFISCGIWWLAMSQRQHKIKLK